MYSPAAASTNDVFRVVPQRRRSSASSTASLHAIAASYSQQEIYNFLLVSKELAAAAEFIVQLLELGGLHDDILLSEFKTILVDLMAERFSEVWDVRQPRRGAGFRTITHSPALAAQAAALASPTPANNTTKADDAGHASATTTTTLPAVPPQKQQRSMSVSSSASSGSVSSLPAHIDPLLQSAFVLCNIHPKHMASLLPVSFAVSINPGLVSYTTTDVDNFSPVHLFEARPYLPPKHQEPVDHGAEARLRALKSVELGHVDIKDFDIDSYFGGSTAAARSRSKEE